MDLRQGRGLTPRRRLPAALLLQRHPHPALPRLGGVGRPEDYAPFRTLWGGIDRERLPIVDTRDGRPVEWLTEPGYTALPALVACAQDGTPFPESLRSVQDGQNYYPTTLHLLALVAARMRYPQCLK